MSKRCEWVGKFGLRRSQFELVDDISSVANLGRRRKKNREDRGAAGTLAYYNPSNGALEPSTG